MCITSSSIIAEEFSANLNQTVVKHLSRCSRYLVSLAASDGPPVRVDVVV